MSGQPAIAVKTRLYEKVLASAQLDVDSRDFFHEKLNHDFLLSRIRGRWIVDFRAREMADLLAALTCVAGVRVLPYHNLSGTKYESLDMTYPLAAVDTPIPTAAEAEAARDVLAARGIRVLR